MFDDLTLVPDDGRAVAVFTLEVGPREALADALSWHVNRRFQTDALEAGKVVELRSAGALADRIDEYRGIDGRAPLRLHADHVRILIEAASAYLMERNVDSYQSPEERARLAALSEIVDPLFDLLAEVDRADEVLQAQQR